MLELPVREKGEHGCGSLVDPNRKTPPTKTRIILMGTPTMVSLILGNPQLFKTHLLLLQHTVAISQPNVGVFENCVLLGRAYSNPRP